MCAEGFLRGMPDSVLTTFTRSKSAPHEDRMLDCRGSETLEHPIWPAVPIKNGTSIIAVAEPTPPAPMSTNPYTTARAKKHDCGRRDAGQDDQLRVGTALAQLREGLLSCEEVGVQCTVAHQVVPKHSRMYRSD
jgi:hypothetical protein